MTFFLFAIALFLLILVLICGIGIGVGFLLHWIIPSIGVEIGTLIGVVTVGWAFYFYIRLMSTVTAIQEDELDTEHSEIETIVLKPIRSRRSSKRKKR